MVFLQKNLYGLLFQVLSNILSILYPRTCNGCGVVLSDEEKLICQTCLSALKKTEEAHLRGNKLEQLFRGFYVYGKEEPIGEKFVRGAAYTYYLENNPIRRIVQNGKFHGAAEMMKYVGHLAAQEMQYISPTAEGTSTMPIGFFENVDMLIPIPLHAERLKERGYNQSEWLARGISEVTGIPIDTEHLYRVQSSSKQSLKTFEERKQLPNVFAVQNPNDLRGKHVMLVDDVITSGTTMARAMVPLHAIPNCTYSVFALSLSLVQIK